MPLSAPFQYIGGKSSIAADVWSRFGDTPNYIEPFFGSGAVLLARPEYHAGGVETVNDADGLLSNFWRAVSIDPDEVAAAADWPVMECDLHARHAWLCGQRDDITRKLEGDPTYYDATAAGWWVWGACAWIGGGWCAPNAGPWSVVDGELLNTGRGIKRKLPHLGDAGRGINRQLPHLGNAGLCEQWSDHLRTMMRALSDRLRRVRVCCGDWKRICGPTPTVAHGLTAVFLDPPYSHDVRDSSCYAIESSTAALDAREWALANGGNKLLRIALCGYDNEHEATMPSGWQCYRWKAQGGYSNLGSGRGRENATRECIWFSPHCIVPQLSLFDEVDPC